MRYFYRVFGASLILSGVILNEWVIKYATHGQTRFADFEKQIFLGAVDLTLIVLGILVIRYQKKALQNILLLVGSVIFSIGVLEIGLRFIPRNLDTEAPKWIPHRYKSGNVAINQQHKLRAKANPYGFNDTEHPRRKKPGLTRIAILGDSFVWGIGVEDHVIWTRKLQNLLNQNGFSVEILNWGKPGWSTLDEFRFLKADGVTYDFDFLLVGFVVNDPVMDGSMHKTFINAGGIIDRLFVQPLSRYLFPNATSLVVDLINGFFDTFFDYGYVNWLYRVYSKENLTYYEALLKEMAEFCRDRHIRMLFVMTPENHHPMLQQRFDQVIQLFHSAGISYVNLYPDVYRQLHHIPNRKLWANPADGHPGDRVTEVYAQSMYRYLIDNDYLGLR